ncbi:hypothetical protein ACERK3_00560 [Phycisphaerales bacterium AB-hyl4]|uniref:Uncharacterized protein n=1 Tax=Natronomicrosphaera hydrolytica TaxID=3242702 RepID=A0ABV4U1Q4_9BACT
MSNSSASTCPLSREQVIERYFLEHRAKLLDVAAFLDRLDRAEGSPPAEADDYRIAALLRAIDVLRDGEPGRARRVLEVFSDPSADPIPTAGAKGATGAHNPQA